MHSQDFQEALMQQELSRTFQSNEEIIQKISNSNPPNIDLLKQNFQKFIDKIGEIKFLPLELDPYIPDFAQTKLEKTINLESILIIYQKTTKKMAVNKKQKKNWSKDDFIIMLWVIHKYNQFNDISIQEYTQDDWKNISSLVPGKDHNQCMFKWLGLKINKYTDKYPWTGQQEQLLKNLVDKKKVNRWFEVSKELYLKNSGLKIYRSPKQCRQRWACYLNPNIKKGPWLPEQDMILLSKYLQIGKKWSNIAKDLNGRTQNAVKNRFNLILQKKQKIKIKQSDEDFIKNYMQMTQLNLFMKTNNPSPKTTITQSFSSNINKEKFLMENYNLQQDLQEYEINQASDIFSQKTEDDNQQQIQQDHRNTKLVQFSKFDFNKLLQICQKIFPAHFDEQFHEIEYNSGKQKIKSEKNIVHFDSFKVDNSFGSEFLYLEQQRELKQQQKQENFLFY